MRVIDLLEDEQAAFEATIETLRAGGVVALPTDTVYGLVADATNEHAVRNVFAIKKRPKEKALPAFVRDIAMARQYAYVHDAKARALERVWPGKVTVVLHHKEKLPAALTGEATTVGVRIPGHPFLARILAEFGLPLAQTSANISDKPPANTAAEVEEYFSGASNAPDVLIDGGKTPGTPSTVIDFTKDRPLVLRTGLISKNELDQILSGFYTG